MVVGLLLARFFPLWAVLASALAWARPDALSGLGGWIVPLLMLIMFGMGMTLTPDDFRRVLHRPRPLPLAPVCNS